MSRASDFGRAERNYYATPDEPEEETDEVYDTDEDWRHDK